MENETEKKEKPADSPEENDFFFKNLRKDYYENCPDQKAIEDFFFENEKSREDL